MQMAAQNYSQQFIFNPVKLRENKNRYLYGGADA